MLSVIFYVCYFFLFKNAGGNSLNWFYDSSMSYITHSLKNPAIKWLSFFPSLHRNNTIILLQTSCLYTILKMMLMILLLQIIIVSHILPITKCCSAYISWVILLNPHNRTLGLGLLLTPLNKCGKWAQRDYKLIFSEISQLVRGRGLESVFRAVFSTRVLILEPLCADKDRSCLHSSYLPRDLSPCWGCVSLHLTVWSKRHVWPLCPIPGTELPKH